MNIIFFIFLYVCSIQNKQIKSIWFTKGIHISCFYGANKSCFAYIENLFFWLKLIKNK